MNPPGGFTATAGAQRRAPRAVRRRWGMARLARGRRRFVRILATLATAGAMLPLAAASAGAATTTAAAGADSVAPGGPGTMSYFDLARKDCVGTATGTASKVWYTVAGGVLSDTYEPDHRQHQREHAAVHRHRRLHVHRPADQGHELHGQRGSHRHGLHGDRDRRPARLPADHHLHHRSRPRHRAHAHPAERPAGLRNQRGRAAPVRAAGRPRQRERWRRPAERRRATAAS